jgi:putative ribosome biogenesis GTPase RsgA
MGIKNYENLVMNEISDKVVVLLGKTGVGKSSFINCITNKNDCKIGKSFESCTQ